MKRATFSQFTLAANFAYYGLNGGQSVNRFFRRGATWFVYYS